MKYSVLVREVMKRKIKKVKVNDRIEKAARIMRRDKIGSVIVMDKTKVVGILTPSDIVYKYVAGKKGKRVKDIMTKRPISISPNKTIEDAARLLVQKRIEKLLVVKKGELVGIISATDILRVEPALFEILLEKMKIGGAYKEEGTEFGECERCGNYSDDLQDINGEWLCEDCRE